MPITMYQASVPVFTRGLGVLTALLEKAAAHAAEKGIDPSELVNARLAPDMLNLAGQIQRSSDTSKLSVERLSGVASPRMEDNETTLPELIARVAKTVAYLDGIKEEQMAGSEARMVSLSFGEFKPSFTGDAYLLSFGLPNFYFHVTTAHDILRHKGVPIGKRDFLGMYA